MQDLWAQARALRPDTDLVVVTGVILLMLAIPSLVAAYADRRAPRAAVFVLMIGAALLGWAFSTAPTDYDLAEIPNAFIRVTGRILAALRRG
ncbi:hypothetical protein [Pseudooceanicola nanhaiensis]|uniref:hypothetical protein n=1 Tax=Pseudooceanicola nanhaiensis TaxID=375761 RepID=UPI001CD1F046|nr:hypothetical protein [Pseudooceanicola nanhaiensis]MCA0921334.1 hypothetical protein [Pseudooceanicola nanhaiensis]